MNGIHNRAITVIVYIIDFWIIGAGLISVTLA